MAAPLHVLIGFMIMLYLRYCIYRHNSFTLICIFNRYLNFFMKKYLQIIEI